MHELDIRRVPKHHNQEPKRIEQAEQNSEPAQIIEDIKLDLTETQPVDFILPQINFYEETGIVFEHTAREEERPRKRTGNFRKAFGISFAVTLFVLFVFAGSRFVNFAKSVSTSQESAFKTISSNIGAAVGSIVPELNRFDSTAISQAIEQKKTINILLLGYGGDGHSGGYLTDTIMVANINFATNKVSLISIPRDLWMQIPTSGYSGSYAKINAAYAFGVDKTHYPNKLPEFSDPRTGGGKLSKFVVSEVLGMPIDYYVSLDFSGFKEIVDDVGGVNVNVDNAFTDYSYPSSDANVNGPVCASSDGVDSSCRYKVVHFDKGEQYMNGERALEYARSRHAAGAEGSDFSRSKRQQKVIVAVEQKALQLNMLPKIFNLMNDLSGHLQTDMTLAEVQNLASYVGNIDLQNANRVSLTDRGGLLVSGYSDDGQWILTPAKGLNDYSAIRAYVKQGLEKDQSQIYGPAKP